MFQIWSLTWILGACIVVKGFLGEHRLVPQPTEPRPNQDWFVRIQELTTRFRGEGDDQKATGILQTLEKVYQDFEAAALKHAMKLVEEHQLSLGKKTFKPLEGHDTYLVDGILFRFSLDWQGLYGEDHFAMKAASQEFKALVAVLNRVALRPADSGFRLPADVRLPVVSVIDYLGHRVLAMAHVPVSAATLSYGQPDTPGEDFHVTQEALASQIFSALHLKTQRASGVDIYTMPDGLHLLGESFGLLPPTMPAAEETRRNGFLWARFRPEFLSLYRGEMNPEALSVWAAGSPEDLEADRRAIADATTWLLQQHIPAVAALVVKDFGASPLDLVGISHRLHERGINLRYLGAFRSALPAGSHLQTLCLVEAVARVIKNEVRAILRGGKNAREGTQLALAYVNKNLRSGEGASLLKGLLEDSFRGLLTAEELQDSFELLSVVPLGLVFHRLREFQAFPLKAKVLGRIIATGRLPDFREEHLQDLGAIVRTLHNLPLERARLLIRGTRGEQDSDLAPPGGDSHRDGVVGATLIRALLDLREEIIRNPDDQEAWALQAHAFLRISRDTSIPWPPSEVARRLAHSIYSARRALEFGPSVPALATLAAAVGDLYTLCLPSLLATLPHILLCWISLLDRLAQMGYRWDLLQRQLSASLTLLEKYLQEPVLAQVHTAATQVAATTGGAPSITEQVSGALQAASTQLGYPGDRILDLPLNPAMMFWSAGQHAGSLPPQLWPVLTTWGQRWAVKHWSEGRQKRKIPPIAKAGGDASASDRADSTGGDSQAGKKDEEDNSEDEQGEDDSDSEEDDDDDVTVFKGVGGFVYEGTEGKVAERQAVYAAIKFVFPPEMPYFCLALVAQALVGAHQTGELDHDDGDEEDGRPELREDLPPRVWELFDAALTSAQLAVATPKNLLFGHEITTLSAPRSQAGWVLYAWGQTIRRLRGEHALAGLAKLREAVASDQDMALAWYVLGTEGAHALLAEWEGLGEEAREERSNDVVRYFTRAMASPSTTLADLPFQRHDYGLQNAGFVTDDIDNFFMDRIARVATEVETARREAAYQLTVLFLTLVARAQGAVQPEWLKELFSEARPMLSSFMNNEVKSKNPQMVECRANILKLAELLQLEVSQVTRELEFRASSMLTVNEKSFSTDKSLSEIEELLSLLRISSPSSRHESSAKLVTSFLKILTTLGATKDLTFVSVQRALEIFSRATEVFSSLGIPPPLWVDPQLGFVLASLGPKVRDQEKDPHLLRKMASEALVHAVDAAFVSAGQQDIPVSEYLRANPEAHGHCQEAFTLCQELTGGFRQAGWLTKRGGFIKSWKRRWFVLEEGEISYFTQPEDSIPKGKIPLFAVSDVVHPKRGSSFTITTSARGFVIEAATPEEAGIWVAAIQGAVVPTQVLKVASFMLQDTMDANKSVGKTLLNSLLPRTVFETRISSVRIFTTMLSDGKTHFN